MATKPTTTITEDDIYKKKVTDPYNEAAKGYQTVYNNSVAEIDKNIDAQKAAAGAQAQQQLNNADKKYRRQYDANAIQEIVDQKALNERMANLGLSKSGLNATQQTAIALARGNRDASTTTSHNQFIDDTNLALQDIYNQAEAERASKKLAAQQQYADDLNATKQGYEKLYNDYLNDQAKQANELKLAQYKALISAGRYDEANALLGGANGGTADGTVGQSVAIIDPKTIPYSQRVYKKVEDPGDFGDFWGVGEDKFYDPVDNEVYSEDQLKNKLLGEGYTEDEAKKSAKFMDDLDAGAFYTPSDIESGVDPKEVFADYIIRYNLYGGNKSLQKKVLVEMGYTEKEANEIIKEFTAG